MKTVAEQINKAKESPEYLEQLIYPGKQISDFNTDDLKIEVLDCGLPSLNKHLVFKKHRGELIFIGARPSMGKSSLLFQIATNIGLRGRSHVISLEDNHDALATRQIAAILNKSMDLIQLGFVTKSELERAKSILSKIDCVVDDTGGLNVYQICERIRMQHQKRPLSAAFVDYIQIIKSDRKISRAEDLGVISTELKTLAKDLKIPIVVASQLNRNSDMRESKTPQLSDLKESGSLEQDADAVLLIHRQGQEAEVIVAKNKNGPTGVIPMKYINAQTKFLDLGGAHELD